MYPKLWAASGVAYPDAARSPDRARGRAPRREAAAPHQPHMTASVLVLGASASCRRCSRSRRACARLERPVVRRGAADLRGVDALVRVYDAILDARFDQADAELDRAAARRRGRPATCWPRPRLVADPARPRKPRARRGVLGRGRRARSPRPRRGRARARRTPKRTSTPAPPTRRACSGACCATRSSRPPATASGSSRRSSAPSRSIPTLEDALLRHRAVSGTTPTSRRRRRRCCASCCCCPAATARRAWRRCGARARAAGCSRGKPTTSCRSSTSGTRSAPTSRSSCSSRCTSAIRAIRCSRPSSPTSGNATSTTSRRASRLARAAHGGARSARQRTGARRSAGAAGRRPQARAARPDRSRARAAPRARSTRSRSAPYGALAAAYLALGEGEDRLGHHDAAIAAYRLAIADGPAPDPTAFARPRERMRLTRPTRQRAEAYRLSLEGLPQAREDRRRRRRTLLARSVALDPRDGVARYRHGRALQARQRRRGARWRSSKRRCALARDCPPPIAAAAYLDAARLQERLGRREQAIGYYRTASTLVRRRRRHARRGDTRAHAARAR